MKGVSARIICLMVVTGCCLACKKPSGSAPVFAVVPESHPLVPVLHEVSGIASSHRNPGMLWAQEDGGNPNRIYLVGTDGEIRKSIYLDGMVNRDWEDMAVSGNDIYLAETGDNFGIYSQYSFYRFPEPGIISDTVTVFETIRFIYPDGPHDAEAFLVDEPTRDIYIISKADDPSRIYRIAFPYRLDTVNRAEWVGSLPYTGVVSAAVSPAGNEVLLKTYGKLYYYARKRGESFLQLLVKDPVALAYDPEPQGEAICFAQDGSGFFTLSETGLATTTQLRFYRRNGQ